MRISNLVRELVVSIGHANTRGMRRAVAWAPALMSIALFFFVTRSEAEQAGFTGNQSASSTTISGQGVTVPAGTTMVVRMIDRVDSEQNRTGDRFRGILESDLMAGDVVVAKKGTTVYAQLTALESPDKSSGRELELDVTEILIDGTLHTLTTPSKKVQEPRGSSTGAQRAEGGGTGANAPAPGEAKSEFGARGESISSNAAGGRIRGQRVSVPAGVLVYFMLDHPVQLPLVER